MLALPRPTRAVLVAAAIFTAVYIALDLNKLYALRYGMDTGVFLQSLTNEAHGRGSWNLAEGRPHLQVHDSWILLLLVPLVAVFPYAQTLLVLQVIAMAAAAPLITMFARACGADGRSAGIVGIAYLISPGTQGIAYGNFLENVLVPVLGAAAALAVRARSLAYSLLLAQMLLGLKEDQSLFLIWFGIAVALWWDRRIGSAIAALAALNGAGYALYEHLVHAAPSVPQYALHVDEPLVKLQDFAALLAPFAFAPLALGWRIFLGAPLVAELTLNRPWAYEIARIGTHWTASILIASALAAAYVVAKRPRFANPMLVLSIVAALAINDTVVKAGRWPYIPDWPAYHRAAVARDNGRPLLVLRPDEGIYAVAAANPNVRLERRGIHEIGYCPAYDTNGRAFFASIGLGAWPRNVRLCGGVPVQQ